MFLVLVAEAVLTVESFLPDDSLLFTAGLLCTVNAADRVHLSLVLVAAVAGALAGAQTLCWHGRAIMLARFVPVVRTVLNPLTWALDVHARTFALWQVTGGLVGAVGGTAAGYLLGSSIPEVDRYLLPIAGGIVMVSLVPVAPEVRRSRRAGVSSRARGRDRAVDR